MQPDLKGRNAASLEFSVTLPLSNELVSKIRDTSAPDSDGDSVFIDSYKRHRVVAVVNGINEDAKDYKIEFFYEAKGGGRLPKKFPRIEQLVDILASIRERLNFECQVLFTFGKNLRPRSIISLPMKYIEVPDMPFDRIQGLHLVKVDNNKTQYDVFLEAPTQGVMFETIVFKYMATIDESLPEKILEEAELISNRFVWKEISDARKPS